jgi:predicted N-acyltransferase
MNRAAEAAGDGSGAASWRIVVHDDPGQLDAAGWRELLQGSPVPTPFLDPEWLAALHRSGSAISGTGWTPVFLTLVDAQGALQAACPLYLKDHSYGEYVFDWAWARALEEAGQPYYPKLLCAVPFTPVPGSRLLARSHPARVMLLAAMQQLARQHGLSSAHLLFMDEADRAAAQAAGWQLRETVQFHWENRAPRPYADFADFLAGLHRDKRKKIQQERRRVAQASVTVSARQGPAITTQDWDFFYACYAATYRAHGSRPYLTRRFFDDWALALPQSPLLFLAEREGRPIASSLLVVDAASGVAWGRYWGSVEWVPCLHFELCYYAPIQWCIEHALQRFEGGAQGEHKMARGLLPVRTWSAHWLAHPGLAEAVERFLARERQAIGAYVSELDDRNPFKPLADGGLDGE